MENLLNNPWLIGIGGTVLASAISYYFFGIGKNRERTIKKVSSKIFAKSGIAAGRDIIINSDTHKNKQVKSGINKKISSHGFDIRTISLSPSECQKNISLPVNFKDFNRLSSEISLLNAKNVKWRAGYIFRKSSNPSWTYVFHVYQDERSNDFHSRIVEIQPNIGEISPDYRKFNIGVEDPKKFKLELKKDKKELHFYVDGIPLGKYFVPLKEINDLSISAWTHNDHLPITISVKNIRW